MRQLGIVLLVSAGCISNHGIGPGVMRDLQQERRDPDPTVDITKQQTTNPWMPEQVAPIPGSKRELLERTAATIAAVIAGAVPMIVWHGTFDENRLFLQPARLPAPTTSPRP